MSSDKDKNVNPGILGIKPYIPGRSVEEVTREYGISSPVKMASNENPLGISPKAREAIQNITERAYQYPEVLCYDLGVKLSEKFNVSPNNIILCNGGDSVIYNLAMCLINEGDEAIIPEITFPVYENIVRAMRGKVVFSKMNEYSIDLDDIIDKITDKTRMIWLCNTNNPTGTIIRQKNFEEFLNKIPENIMVVNDEVYFDYALEDNEYPNTLKMIKNGRNNLFIIRSFSKIYGLAGVRLGYGIGPESLIKLMYRIRIPFDVSVLANAAGVAALADTEFYSKSLEITKKGKDYIYKELTALGLEYIPSYTNFIIIDTGKNASEVFTALIKKGVIIRPMTNYGLPRFIRVTIGLDKDNKKFIAVLKQVLEL